MLWKLRLLWYRADKAALAFGLFFSLIVGALIFALNLVFWDREAQAARLRSSTPAAWTAWRATCTTRRAANRRRGSTRSPK